MQTDQESANGPQHIARKVAWCVATTMMATGALARAAEEPAAEQSRFLEEIVVTAEKRESTVQRTPAAISAFTADTIEMKGIENAYDIEALVPNLTITNNGNIGQIYIRGIGSDALGVGTDGSTTVHLNGVYVARGASYLIDFADVERIEVLRGPQGTLYGRNSAGGTINIISKQPVNEFEANAEVSLGNFELWRINAGLNVPLIEDRLLLRVTGRASDREGVYDNLNSLGPRHPQRETAKGGRLQLRFLPTDQFEALLSADYYDGGGQDAGVQNRPLEPGTAGLFGANFIPPEPDIYLTNTPREASLDQLFSGASLTLNWTPGDIRVTSITAYRETEWFQVVDADGTDAPVLDFDWGEDEQQFSQEFQIASTGESTLDWIAGLYYYATSNGVLTANLAFPLFGLTVLNVGENETEAYAAFGQATYAVTDRLRLTGGVRYSSETKDAITNLFINGFPAGSVPGKETWTATTPKFVADLQVAEDIFSYLSVSKGFKSGGFNSAGLQGPFDPENIWAYEVGIKLSPAHGRLQINGAAFYYDYEDLQVNKHENNLTTITNAAKARVQGVELEAIGKPSVPLTLTVNLALLDAIYKEYETEDPSRPGVLQDLEGNNLSRAPKVTAYASAQYDWRLGPNWTLTLLGEFSYQDRVFFSPFNDPAISQDPVGTLNARISLRNDEDTWHLTAWGQNLTDEVLYGNIFRFDSTGFNPMAELRDPLTYGVTIKRNFH